MSVTSARYLPPLRGIIVNNDFDSDNDNGNDNDHGNSGNDIANDKD